MRLELENGKVIKEPDDAAIKDALGKLRPEEGYSFAILDAETKKDYFIQTSLGPQGFLVEYKEGQRQYQSKNERLELKSVSRLFRLFGRGDSSWKQQTTWKPLEKKMKSNIRKAGTVILWAAALLGSIFLLTWLEWQSKSYSQKGSILFEDSTGIWEYYILIMGLIVFGGLIPVGVALFFRAIRGFFASRTTLKSFAKTVGLLLLSLGLTGFGCFMSYCFTFVWPCSKSVVVHSNAQILEVKENYWLRDASVLTTSFGDIRTIVFKKYAGYYSTGYREDGEVIVETTDGREITITSDGPKSQYRLAKAISKATGKPLVKREE